MVDGMAAYEQSVALQDTRFAHFLLLPLARELDALVLNVQPTF
jgi:hypothetical protein